MGILKQQADLKRQVDELSKKLGDLAMEACLLQNVKQFLIARGIQVASDERIEIEWEKFKKAITL